MSNIRSYIGLGANLGDAKSTLLQAAAELENHSAIRNMRLSALYDTSPVGCTGPDYVNAVAELWTDLDAIDLLAVLQQIEQQHGRLRPYKNAPRTLDLDLLWYDDQIINLDNLIVPHPRMHLRAFVLKPLQDLNPDLVLTQGSITGLLAQCTDQRIELLE